MPDRVKGKLGFALVALVGAFAITYGIVQQPGFTDAFYHFNAAERLASGQGLTDPYLWTYIGAPDTLPAPSHLYWMPLTSLTAAFGMWALNAPGSYAAAQWPLALMLAGTAYTGFWLGHKLGGTRRHAWVAGLITLFSGYYTRFWGATDTFAPYALVGSLALVLMGTGVEQTWKKPRRAYLYGALAGILAGLAHLTRADGLLFLVVGWIVILWPRQRDCAGEQRQITLPTRITTLAALTMGYLLTMLPWFIRNWQAIGTPMPLGGTQGIWFASYNDIFNYPPDANPADFFANGLGLLLATRWEAFSANMQSFIAVEGLIVMTPLMLIGLWQRRQDGFLRGFWLYALGMHLAMTFVFPFPGYRGGLLHSAAALIPWWAALGVLGLDDLIEWIAQRRRRWKARTAKQVYSVMLVAVAVFMSVFIALPNRVLWRETPTLYRELLAKLPANARVMINDPAQLYYYTGMGGVVLPNETPEVIPEIARQYRVGYLVLEGISADGRVAEAATPSLWPILYTPYDFLQPIPLETPGVRLYTIRYQSD